MCKDNLINDIRMGIVNIYELMSSQNGDPVRVRHPTGVQTRAMQQTRGIHEKRKPLSGRTTNGKGVIRKR